jgi:hypothetical protein
MSFKLEIILEYLISLVFSDIHIYSQDIKVFGSSKVISLQVDETETSACTVSIYKNDFFPGSPGKKILQSSRGRTERGWLQAWWPASRSQVAGGDSALLFKCT